MRDLIDGEAELNDEEDDESFDEDTGESRVRDRKKMLDDSSEEDEDDEDEEEARRVCIACPLLSLAETY
jgi:transcription elongation factor SPT6